LRRIAAQNGPAVNVNYSKKQPVFRPPGAARLPAFENGKAALIQFSHYIMGMV
jgi:hypothetical protein